MRRFTLGGGLRWAVATVLVVGLLVAAAVVGGHVVKTASGPPTQTVGSPSDPPRPVGQSANDATPSPAAGDNAVVVAQLDRMRHLPAVRGAPQTEATITGDATTQPDLFAAEFVRRLLTQDFHSSRHGHLAWVQSESATTTEPLVVGLVPADLRDRLAVFTVIDAGEGPALVPSAAAWQALAEQAAYDTATVDQVIEPLAWRNAVAAGRVGDPGVTCRVVAATVTRHERIDGHGTATKSSVSVTLNLEGPPTRTTWAFVAAIDVTTLPMGTL